MYKQTPVTASLGHLCAERLCQIGFTTSKVFETAKIFFPRHNIVNINSKRNKPL